MLFLRVEPTQLLCVLWVVDVFPCLGVVQSIRTSWNCFVDEIWPFPWWLQLRRAYLVEVKDEVAWLEGPPAYPSAVVIAEALLVNCRAGEGDVPGLIQQSWASANTFSVTSST
jgi:hypothetical protein